MLDFYKPDWLYESLPYLYVAAGGGTIAILEHWAALLGGGLLIMTGVYVWNVRRSYRHNSPLAKFRPLNRLR